MKVILIASVVAFLMTGCGKVLTVDPSRVVEPPAGADAAIADVEAFYGLRARPQIYWYEAMDCPGIPGGTGIVLDDGICRGGAQDSYHGNDLIVLALFPALQLHEMDLSHELGHRSSDERGEGGDQGHTGHFFAPGGDVEQSNALLQSAGY